MAVPGGEILVLPFSGQGHLFPCIELCKHLSSRNYRTTLLISSAVSSSIPASLLRHPLIRVSEIPCSPIPPPPEAQNPPGPMPSGNPFREQQEQMGKGIESLLAEQPDGSTRPVCAVIDVMMSWAKELFARFEIPTVVFFTSGACSAAMEYATWKARTDNLQPGEIRLLPGLPDEMAVSCSDLKRRPHRRGRGPPGPGFVPPHGGRGGPPLGGPVKPFGRKFRGPPGPGDQPIWLEEVEGSIAVLMNTCQELEGPFLDYVAQKMGKPVWGVGPLLPAEYWESAGSLLRDRWIRPKKQSSHSEEELIQWLDSKTRGSILYISFGSEVGPTPEEYAELASALEESNRPFIWVVRTGSGRPGPTPETSSSVERKGDGGYYYPHCLKAKVGERGVIISGWAPQLLILSHPSTGGFLTHCGWNSTAEAVGCGVPMLAWPIRGDQFYNAKLVVSHLKVGCMVFQSDASEMVKKDDILKGIERLMGDEGVKERAAMIKGMFQGGFLASSKVALDSIKDFLGGKME